MLYKNDEIYKLAPNDVKVITNKFHGKWPLLVIYPPERIIKSRSKENRLPDKPNSISFPLKAVEKSINGTDQWRYAENVIIKEHGVKKYTPKNFVYKGRTPLSEEDIELAWFLYTKSPYCKGGMNQGKTIKFTFDDPITDADRLATTEAQRARFKTLIHDKEYGLSEPRLRQVAKALFIKDVDSQTFSQIKLAIDHAVTRGGGAGYDRFMDMVNAEDLIKARSKIQGLVDKGMLKYIPTKKEWIWMEDDKRSTRICKVPTGIEPSDAIYDFYMGDKEFQQTVELTEKAKTGKGKKDEEPDETPE